MLQALSRIEPAAEVLWVGGIGGMEAELVQRAGLPYTEIPAAGLHGVGWRNLPRNISQMLRGISRSRQILSRFRPDVLFFTGGYVAGPMAFAGRRLPALVYVPDIEPGLALKSIARFADQITVTTADSTRYFNKPHKVVVTGYPTRPDLHNWDRQAARQVFELNKAEPVLLVTGGSKGARSINQAVINNLDGLLSITQIIHITGQLDWPVVEAQRTSLAPAQAVRYRVYPYLHAEMGAALAAADLVVARAGASTLGEFPLFGLPAILVPYPHAWRYQQVNAQFLVQRGAAEIVDDARLGNQLLRVVSRLLSNPESLEQMRKAMQALAQSDSAEKIARLLTAMAASRHRGEGRRFPMPRW